MQRTLGFLAFLIAAVAGLAGCDSGRKTPPSVGVTTVHAASGYGDIRFLRVEREEAILSYRQAASHVFDADTYTFNLEVSSLEGTESGRVASFTETLVEGTRYIFTFVDVGGLLQALVTESPRFQSQTDAQIQVIDAASATPQTISRAVAAFSIGVNAFKT